MNDAAGDTPTEALAKRLAGFDFSALLTTVQAATIITDNLERVLRHSDSGLRANDFDALFFVVAEGSIRPSELIRLTALTRSPATLHKILGRLQANGHVVKAQHPEHARGVLYSPTDKGRETIVALWPTVERRVVGRFSRHFSQEELEQLKDLTTRV